ncbi:imidazole glycerol phosphate synthase subunit HisF [Synechococcus moorigangaii CMS01]|nr:imidazole glycerol phosphate synthase subunit HisF [Synechococcus moorigangaii CMS01]
MLKKRLIAVLILRDGQVVQSVRFKHTNVIHYDPIHAVDCFNRWAVDEIVMLNVSPCSNSRQVFLDCVKYISKKCFVPLSTGGWITDADYARELLHSGADKLIINTLFFDNPDLVSQLSSELGCQCIVASMDIQKNEDNNFEVIVDRGQRTTKIDPITWARQVKEIGAGEIFFNSINHDGARKGYDLLNLGNVCRSVSIPVIAFGGVFTWKHLIQGIEAGADAVAVANILHYTEHSAKKAKKALIAANIPVRKV